MEKIHGKVVQKPARKPSLKILSMADIIEGVNAVLNPGKPKINWFAPAKDAIAAVHIKDGKYLAEQSNSSALFDGTVSDTEVNKLKVVAYQGNEGGLYVEGTASDVILDGAYISTAGDGEGIGGPASGVAVKYNGKLTIKNTVIDTNGRTRYATAAEEGSVLKVYDSILWAHGIPYGEDIEQPSALMSTPPPPLEINGNTRCHCTMSNSSSYFYRSKIICDGWAALSTESSEGYVYLEANDCDIICTKSGYGAYSDPGCHDVFNHCNFEVANMTAILAGNSDMTFKDCSANCGSYFALSHCVNGWAEEVAELTILGGSIKTKKEAILIKSHNAIIELNKVNIASEKGILVHSIKNDDPCTTNPGDDPYGIDVIMKDLDVKGDLIHEDTDRAMWINLNSTIITGRIVNAVVCFDIGSKWIATEDSNITLSSEVDIAQIDAYEGVTITAKGQKSGTYNLSSGGTLIIEA